MQKYRQQHQAYVVEGPKLVAEWLQAGAPLELLAATPEWLADWEGKWGPLKGMTVVAATAQQLNEASGLKTSPGVLAVAKMPESKPLPESLTGWTLVLAGVQDPGNVGAIIRIADWFGIPRIVASPDSASYYNPKVVQAAMGGHLRVELYTLPIEQLLHRQQLPAFATVLGGVNAFEFTFPEQGLLMIGNESKGLDANLTAQCSHRLAIPSFGGAESLNAAVAAGIFCSLIKRGKAEG